jgi:hypothetical protein
MHLVPVLFGSGTRMFEQPSRDHIQLEPADVIDAPRDDPPAPSRARPAVLSRVSKPGTGEQPGRQLPLGLRNGTGTDRHHAPSGTVAQRALDTGPHGRFVLRVRYEQCPEPGRLAVRLDGAVVRPAAGSLVLPVATKLDRHRGADGRRVGLFAQGDLRLDHKGSDVGFGHVAWDQSSFEQATELGESAEVLDGLSQAVQFQGDHLRAIELKERTFAAYQRRGMPVEAAELARWLAFLHAAVYGNLAAAGGWMSRAERLLEGVEPCAAHGWLTLDRAPFVNDPSERERLATAALSIARRFGDRDL